MREQPRLLIVEDDAELRGSLVERLSHGFVPIPVADAQGMFASLEAAPVDAILLDVLLPGVDGLSLCRELRKEGSPYASIPIIMVSALGDPTDRVAGLHAGADDYLSKPFFTAELIARIHAVLRRSTSAAPSKIKSAGKISFGEWTLDRKSRQLTNDKGLVVMLTPGDYRLLSYFLSHPNKILSREELIDHVEASSTDLQNISVRIRRLRVKLGEDSKNSTYIQAFRNEGYMWKMPVKEEGCE
ncbi:MAG: response regulator transcription factor [Mailhella sp.]|nr:response regulator transcription factor [Mailhella sp.]